MSQVREWDDRNVSSPGSKTEFLARALRIYRACLLLRAYAKPLGRVWDLRKDWPSLRLR